MNRAIEISKRIAAELDATPANTPALRAIRKRYSNEIAGLAPRMVLEIADALLIHCPHRRWVAYELVHHHTPAMQELVRRDVESLGQGMASWAEVDTFACYISGPAWREGRLEDAVIRHWAKSRDRWWRRAALVSTVPLNVRAQGGLGDPERTLKICKLLVGDRDDMVVKALSWALRALTYHDRQSVQDFIDEHYETLASRVIREVRSKLATGLKNPKKRDL